MGTLPDLTVREEKAWTGLLRAHAALVRNVDDELRAAVGLPLSWYEVLQAVAAAPGAEIRMGDLAAKVMMTRAGISGLVDRLETAGLVARRSTAADGRVTHVVLTADGVALLERARATRRDAIRRRYTGLLDAGELGVMTRIWERLDGVRPST